MTCHSPTCVYSMKVATLVKDSDPKVLVLNESTLDEYGLRAVELQPPLKAA